MESGSVVAGRYVLGSHAAFSTPSAVAWEARDTRLGVPVTLLLAGDAGRGAFRDAAEKARTVRDARLARIIEVGLVETDAPFDAGRPFVVFERPAGLSLDTLLSSRVVPFPVARALIGETARVVQVAAGFGLRHGSIAPELITVTPRGRVILTGAGVFDALTASTPGTRAITERDDAVALGLLLVRAITGRDPEGLTREDLPTGLTRGARDLSYVVCRGTTRPGLHNILSALDGWDPTLLRALPTARTKFPRLERPSDLGIGLTTDELAAMPLAPVTELAPALEEEASWDLDFLEEVAVADATPSIFEALLSFLNRRYPRSAPIARLLEKVHARALSGPQINTTRWFLLGGLVALVVIFIWAMQWMLSPYVPTMDLHNPPPHSYPSFTFGPDETISPSPQEPDRPPGNIASLRSVTSVKVDPAPRASTPIIERRTPT